MYIPQPAKYSLVLTSMQLLSKLLCVMSNRCRSVNYLLVLSLGLELYLKTMSHWNYTAMNLVTRPTYPIDRRH